MKQLRLIKKKRLAKPYIPCDLNLTIFKHKQSSSGEYGTVFMLIKNGKEWAFMN